MGQAKQRAAEIAEIKRRTEDLCVDCQQEHFAYFTTSEVWKAAKLKVTDGCCWDCLSKRLGRSPKPEELAWRASPVNWFFPCKFADGVLLDLIRGFMGERAGLASTAFAQYLHEERRKRFGPEDETIWEPSGQELKDLSTAFVLSAVLQERREHPEGLTERQVTEWMEEKLGIEITAADYHKAEEEEA